MVTAVFQARDTAKAAGLWQYDYGQVLRIEGLALPREVEIHFSLRETGGIATRRVGITKDGVTDVLIPDSMLENNKASSDYSIYVFIYMVDDTSGETTKKITMPVKARPEPEASSRPDEPDIFHETIRIVNEKTEETEKYEVGISVYGSNILEIYGFSASTIDYPLSDRELTNNNGTTISTIEPQNEVEISQEIIGENPISYKAGYFCVGINDVLEEDKMYIISFYFDIKKNPLNRNEITIMSNGVKGTVYKDALNKRIYIPFIYKSYKERRYIEIRNNGMSGVFRDFAITPIDVGDVPYEPYKPVQSLILSTPNGLAGIPVSSGGNYTDENGQQWVADEIVLNADGAGKLVKRTKIIVNPTFEISPGWITGNPKSELFKVVDKDISGDFGLRAVTCTKLPTTPVSSVNTNGIYAVNSAVCARIVMVDSVNEFNSLMKEAEILVALKTPIEISLTAEEVAAFKAMHTNYPTTVITNDADCRMEIEYKSDTKHYIDNKFAELQTALTDTQAQII